MSTLNALPNPSNGKRDTEAPYIVKVTPSGSFTIHLPPDWPLKWEVISKWELSEGFSEPVTDFNDTMNLIEGLVNTNTTVQGLSVFIRPS